MIKHIFITLTFFIGLNAKAQDSCFVVADYTYVITDSTIEFTNTSTDEPEFTNYLWDIYGTASTEENPVFSTDSISGVWEVCLTVSDSLTDCQDTACYILYIPIEIPPCELTTNFDYIISDNILYLTNTSTGEPADPNYSWIVDGLSSSEEHPTFSTLEMELEEEVCLTVYNYDLACYDTLCQDIYIGLDSSACNLSVLFESEAIDDTLYLTNTSEWEPDGATYFWEINGLTSSEENPSFPTAGMDNYETICFFVYDPLGECSDSTCWTVSTLDTMDCTIIADFTFAVTDSTIEITNTSSGIPDSPIYQWEVEGITSSEENPTFSTDGIVGYTYVCLTLFDSLSDCFDSTCYFVSIPDLTPPDCIVETSFSYVVSDGTLYLSNTSTDEPADALYEWYIDGLTSTLENPTFSTDGMDEYETICFTVYDSLWGCSDSVCSSIYIGPDSSGCVLTTNFYSYVLDGELYLYNTSTGEPTDAIYDWTVADVSSSEENPILSTDGMEMYELVCLTVRDSLWECYDSICEVVFIGADSSGCELVADFTYDIIGENVTLTNTSTGVGPGASYNWYFNETDYTGESVIVPVSDFSGEETICLTVSDSFCIDTICYSYFFELDSSICEVAASFTYSLMDDTLYLTNTSTDAPVDPQFAWHVNGLTSFEENPSFSTEDFDTYETICFTIYDSLWTCYDSLCTTVFIDSSEIDSVASIPSYDNFHVSLYPNPATSIITIEISNAEEGGNILTIQNALGQVIRNEQISFTQERVNLDVTDLPSGLYIVTVIDEKDPERIIQEKFIKK